MIEASQDSYGSKDTSASPEITGEELKMIKRQRKQHDNVDNPQYREKRLNFLVFLSKLNDRSCLNVFEMRPAEDRVLKSQETKAVLPHEIHYSNTRYMQETEIILESDKENGFEIICKVAKRLNDLGRHYAIFFAAGQKSPHIRIYDLLELKELDLDSFQRSKAREEFVKQELPEFYNDIDQSLFVDSHPIQLEFAPHWKYGTMFDLIHEYIPQETKSEKQESLI